MASSKQIKLWIAGKKKTVVRLEKEIKAAKAKIKKLEGDMKKAAAREKAAPKKKAAKKKVSKKKKPARKKAAPKKKKAPAKRKAKK